MVLYGKDQAAAVQLFATAFPACIMAPIIFMACFSFFAAALPALVEFAAANWFIASVRLPLTWLAAAAFFFPPFAIASRALLAFLT